MIFGRRLGVAAVMRPTMTATKPVFVRTTPVRGPISVPPHPSNTMPEPVPYYPPAQTQSQYNQNTGIVPPGLIDQTQAGGGSVSPTDPVTGEPTQGQNVPDGSPSSGGSSPVCEPYQVFDVASNMCVDQYGPSTGIVPPGLDPTAGGSQYGPNTGIVPPGMVNTTMPITAVPLAPPMFWETPAFKLGMIAIGVSALAVTGVLVHRRRSLRT